MDKWDYAHMKTAENYAQLSSARRLKVGAVIVKDNRIISIGYNGMPSKWDNDCEHVLSENDGVVSPSLKTKDEVIHAESNAITKVARSNESSDGSVIYTTCSPCIDCAKLIYQSGISKVFYKTLYIKGDDGIMFLNKCGIETNRI